MSSARASSLRKVRKRSIGRRRVGAGEGARRWGRVGRSRVGGVGVPVCSSPHLSSTPAGRAKLRSTAPVSSSPHGHVSAGRL